MKWEARLSRKQYSEIYKWNYSWFHPSTPGVYFFDFLNLK